VAKNRPLLGVRHDRHRSSAGRSSPCENPEVFAVTPAFAQRFRPVGAGSTESHFRETPTKAAACSALRHQWTPRPLSCPPPSSALSDLLRTTCDALREARKSVRAPGGVSRARQRHPQKGPRRHHPLRLTTPLRREHCRYTRRAGAPFSVEHADGSMSDSCVRPGTNPPTSALNLGGDSTVHATPPSPRSHPSLCKRTVQRLPRYTGRSRGAAAAASPRPHGNHPR
jgi:hypothetical protein